MGLPTAMTGVPARLFALEYGNQDPDAPEDENPDEPGDLGASGSPGQGNTGAQDLDAGPHGRGVHVEFLHIGPEGDPKLRVDLPGHILPFC